MDALVSHFLQIGFSGTAARAKAKLFERCATALGKTPGMAFYVPGRVELLGKHTDYAGGRSLTCAIDRGIMVAMSVQDNAHVLLHACDLKQTAGFAMAADTPNRGQGWLNYAKAVARRLARNLGEPLRGAEIAFASDLPPAAGMSSSSALVVAIYMALNAANGFDQREVFKKEIQGAEDLAGYLGTCENGQNFRNLQGDRGVGTFGGSEDHTAIVCSKPGQLNLYTYCPVRLEKRIEFPGEMVLAIGCSGVLAEKTGAAMEAYNDVSRKMGAIMQCLREAGWDKPTLAAAIGDDAGAAQCVRQILAQARHEKYTADELLKRFDQFVMEHQQLIPAVVGALERRDWETLGKKVFLSQQLAETHLGNQVPQTIALAQGAYREGAIAASAFGAGFGGSVWAMVPQEQAHAFLRRWEADYQQHGNGGAAGGRFLLTHPVGGAHRVL